MFWFFFLSLNMYSLDDIVPGSNGYYRAFSRTPALAGGAREISPAKNTPLITRGFRRDLQSAGLRPAQAAGLRPAQAAGLRRSKRIYGLANAFWISAQKTQRPEHAYLGSFLGIVPGQMKRHISHFIFQ